MALVVIACVGVARADEPHDANNLKADALTRDGTLHFRLNEFDAALKDYKEAYRLAPRSELLYDIGQCYRKLDQKQAAVDSFKNFLQESNDEEQKASVRGLVEKLEAAIRQESAARNAPPQGPIVPLNADTGATNADVATAQSPPVDEPRADKPIYKRWWLWTAVVGVVAVGVGVGLGVGLSSGPAAPSARTSAGTFRF